MSKKYILAGIAVFLSACMMLAGCSSVAPNSSDLSSDITSSDTVSSDVTSSAETSSEPDSSEEISSKETASEEEAPYPVITSDEKVIDHGSIVTIGDTGYEYYTYVPKKAEIYAGLINDVSAKMSENVSVYSIIAPISTGITLPDNHKDSLNNSDIKTSLEQLSGLLSEDVLTVDAYDKLMRHRDEYLYFRTDHHWTARGAYYAYAAFCESKGITPHALTDYTPRNFEGFLGTFYKDSNQLPAMEQNPDVVEAFYPVGENIKLKFTDTKGNSYDWPIISNVESSPASLKYSTFAAADNPYTIITNADITDGSSLVVVKESYANALIPFLADHYQTIHVIDYRYWKGSLVSFVEENAVQDVMFVNNISMTRSDYLIGKLSQILG